MSAQVLCQAVTRVVRQTSSAVTMARVTSLRTTCRSWSGSCPMQTESHFCSSSSEWLRWPRSRKWHWVKTSETMKSMRTRMNRMNLPSPKRPISTRKSLIWMFHARWVLEHLMWWLCTASLPGPSSVVDNACLSWDLIAQEEEKSKFQRQSPYISHLYLVVLPT